MFKYEVGNCLNNQLLFLQMRKSNMGHLNRCLLLNTKKPNNVAFKNSIQFFCLICIKLWSQTNINM